MAVCGLQSIKNSLNIKVDLKKYVCSGCGVSNLAGFFHTSSITGDTCTARLCVHMVQLKSGLCVSEPSSTQG